MRIVGYELESFCDYPGKCCTTIFLPTCNFNCPWCFNVDLVQNRVDKNYKIEIILKLIQEANSPLQHIKAITITGGEPTLYQDLSELCKKIKKKGLLVKLDTNGSNPQMLSELVADKLVDYIAMDVKYLLQDYERAIGKLLTILERMNIRDSIDILKSGKVDYEFRTTLVPGLHTTEVIQEMSEFLKDSKVWYLQNFFTGKKYLNSEYEKASKFSSEEMESFINVAKRNIKRIGVRGL